MSLRWKILPPLTLCVLVVLGALALWQRYSGAASLTQWLTAAAALLCALWLLFEYWIRRPLAALARTTRSQDELAALDAQLSELRSTLVNREHALAKSIGETQRIENELRQHEQRYLLAVKGSNDGLWEWDIGSGAMYLSPRWKSMFGFDIEEIKDHIEAWKNQLHLEERPAIEAALTQCVAGTLPRFESQHRVMCRDTSFRWVLSRATVLRSASGKAYRMIGLDTDITEYRRLQDILRNLAEGTAASTGDEFFRVLVKHFAAIFGVRQVFVTECVNYPTTRMRPLATWDSGRFIDDPEYDLAGTPCEEVVAGNRSVFYPTDVDRRYQCSAAQGFTSYFGMPIADSQGKVIGHLVCQGPEIISEDLIQESIYRIFVARAGAELERRNSQRMLLEVVGALSQTRGEESFRMLARSFAAVTQMREAFVARCVEQPPRTVQMLAWWRDGEFLSPISYAVQGSVCEETILRGRICQYSSGVGKYFNYQAETAWESYLGVPCFDAQGHIVGHLAAADRQPTRNAPPDEAILRLLAERAAAELERQRLALARSA